MNFLTTLQNVLKNINKHIRVWLWDVYRNFRKEITVSTQQGVFSIFLAKNESIGRSLYVTGQYEIDLIDSIPTFLEQWQAGEYKKNAGAIIDVGANNGVISVSMLYKKYFDRAVAVEPEPKNFSILQKNVGNNKFQEKILCLPLAVSDKKAEISFELSETNFGDHRVRNSASSEAGKHNEAQRQVIHVQSVTLDDLVNDLPEAYRQNISVIWIDVQGHEGFVFKGAENLISKGIPFVAEIWPYGIKRAGMTEKEFCDIAAKSWKHYWVRRRGKFIKYPVEILHVFFDELGYDGAHDNVIFTK